MWCFFLETKVPPARRVGARRALLSNPGGLAPRRASPQAQGRGGDKGGMFVSIFTRNWATDVRPSWSTDHETLGQFPTVNGATMTLIFVKAIGR
jgi:hypothetical protein